MAIKSPVSATGKNIGSQRVGETVVELPGEGGIGLEEQLCGVFHLNNLLLCLLFAWFILNGR